MCYYDMYYIPGIEGSCVANCGRFEECGNLTDYECECIDGYYDYEEEDYCQGKLN